MTTEPTIDITGVSIFDRHIKINGVPVKDLFDAYFREGAQQTADVESK